MAPEKPSSGRRIYSRDESRAEMRQRLQLIVGLAPDRNRKAALTFAAAALRLPYSLCKRLLYGEVLTIEAHLADQIRAYTDAASKVIEARQNLDRSRDELLAEARSLRARLAPPEMDGAEVQAAQPKKVARR